MATKKVMLEVASNQYDVDAVSKKALDDFKKNNKAAVKDIQVYIKPEDGKAYYVVNGGKFNGSVDL